MIHTSASEAELSPLVVEASNEYVGRWNRLVSTTNWEKGRIIFQWRKALEEAGAPVAECTDEAWSQQVGGVTAQHVGRLRRVHERFGDLHEQYAGLFWSHFCTALDWSDAEMWLEGATQNDWSISQMREQRWETLGAPADMKPGDSEIFVGEVEENDETAVNKSEPEPITETMCEVVDSESEDADSSNSAPFDEGGAGASDADHPVSESKTPVRPFEKLAALPADLQEAFELFKLAIISHKLTKWEDIALDDVLSALDSLKQLAIAPTE